MDTVISVTADTAGGPWAHWWALASTVVGALIGGLGSYWGSERASKRAERQLIERDRVHREQSDKAMALSLQFKIARDAQRFFFLRCFFEDLKKKVDLETVIEKDLALVINATPVAGINELSQNIEVQEFGFLLGTGQVFYTENVNKFAESARILTAMMEEYNTRLPSVKFMIKPDRLNSDDTAEVNISHDQYMALVPYLANIRSLIENIVRHLDDVPLMLAVARDYGKVVRGYFRDEHMPVPILSERMLAVAEGVDSTVQHPLRPQA